MENLYLCSFADSRMSPTLERVRKQAEASSFFEKAFLYDEHSLGGSFWEKFGGRLVKGSRGFGYWVWKPYVVLETLRKIPDGAVLLYMDAGCWINPKGYKTLEFFVNKTLESPSGLLVYEIQSQDCLEKYWTKGDLLDFFGVRDVKEIVDSEQICATAFLIRKDAANIEFVEKWLAVFDRFDLVDDTPSVSCNLDGFVENRHDQSVFSLMTKIRRGGIVVLPDTFLCKNTDNPVWTLRDKKIKLRYRYSLKRFLGKVKRKICERLK